MKDVAADAQDIIIWQTEIERLEAKLKALGTFDDAKKAMVDANICRNFFNADARAQKKNPDRFTTETSTMTGGQCDKFFGIHHGYRFHKYDPNGNLAEEAPTTTTTAEPIVECSSCGKGGLRGLRGLRAHLHYCTRGQTAPVEAPNGGAEAAAPPAAAPAATPSSRPFWKVVIACVGDCGHSDEAKQRGSLAENACWTCNVFSCFYTFGVEMMPKVQAMTREELDAVSPNGKYEWRAFRDDVTRPWANRLLLTFSMYCQSPINIYAHHFEHIPYLLYLFLMGPWSQEAVEHDHKNSKATFGQCTSHEGGRVGADTSALVQIVNRNMRLLISEIREAAALPTTNVELQAWRACIAEYVAPSEEEATLMASSETNLHRRVRNFVCRKLGEANVADENAEQVETETLEQTIEHEAE